jgi:hypothetical protein
MVTTGTNFMDRLMSGGAHPGELIGIFSPTGCGRSFLASQLTISLAKQIRDDSPERVLFLCPDDSEYHSRLIAAAADLDLNAARQRDPSSEVHGKLRAARRFNGWVAWQPHSISRPADVAALASKFDPLAAIVIDDAFAGLEGQISENPLRTYNFRLSKKMLEFTGQLKGLADRYKCPIFVTHALHGRTNTTAPHLPLTHHDAANCRQLDKTLDWAFCLGNEEQVARLRLFTCSLARRDPPADPFAILRFQEQGAQFADVSREFRRLGRRFVCRAAPSVSIDCNCNLLEAFPKKFDLPTTEAVNTKRSATLPNCSNTPITD